MYFTATNEYRTIHYKSYIFVFHFSVYFTATNKYRMIHEDRQLCG